MTRAHRLLTTGLATLGVLAGGLVFSSAPALAAAPEAPLTEAPTPFAGTTATLKGELNPVSSSEAVTYHFAYSAGPGATCTESELTAPVEGPFPDAAGKHKKVTEAVEGLEGSTEYTVCLIAANPTEPAESTQGTSVNFTTHPAPPEVIAETEYASPVTATEATLNALINPNNQSTTYTFEYASSVAAIGTPGATPVPEVEPPLTGGFVQSVSVSTGAVLKAGETYYYRVVAENKTSEEEHKPVTGAIQSFTTQGPPVVSTGEAQNITRTTATFSGTVNPTGVETTYYFAYIGEAGYQAALAKGAPNPYAEGETTAPIGAGSSYETQAVGPIPASAMLPETTYRYELVARNELGVTIGPDETVRTLSRTPPTVTTGGARGVSQNAATLSGTVGTNGLQTEYGFQIGTEAGNYGPATGLGSVGGALTETVTLTLGELQPGTTYHYRVLATNSDGASYGADQTFTTPAFPALLTVPLAPSLLPAPAVALPTQAKATTTPPKILTNAQKLKKALKSCKKDKVKKKRESCEKAAQKKYGKKTKAKK
jgi:hypothetical protein